MALVIRDPSKRPSALGVGQEETVPSSGLCLPQSLPHFSSAFYPSPGAQGAQHSHCLKKQPFDSTHKPPSSWHALPKFWPKSRARSHATHFSNKTMSGSHRDSEGTRIAVIPPYSSGFQESLWSIHSYNRTAESSAHSYAAVSFLTPSCASTTACTAGRAYYKAAQLQRWCQMGMAERC